MENPKAFPSEYPAGELAIYAKKFDSRGADKILPQLANCMVRQKEEGALPEEAVASYRRAIGTEEEGRQLCQLHREIEALVRPLFSTAAQEQEAFGNMIE